MKGDFSGIPDIQDYDALLVQQGRPLLDSQINGISLAALRGRESALSELLGLNGSIFFPPKDEEGSISHDDGILITPKDIVYVNGIRAHVAIESPVPAGRGYLGLDVIEEVLHIRDLSGNKFSDLAVHGSESTRLKRSAKFRFIDQVNDHEQGSAWNPSEDKGNAPLTVRLPGHQVSNGLYRFMIADTAVGASAPGPASKLRLLFSKNNSGSVFSIEQEIQKDKSLKPKIEGNKVFLHSSSRTPGLVSQNQVVQFVHPQLAVIDSIPAIMRVTTIEDDHIVVEQIDTRDSEQKTAQELLGDIDPVEFVVWESLGYLEPENADGLHLTCWFEGVHVSLPIKQEGDSPPPTILEPGDYWICSVREKARSRQMTVSRRSPILARAYIGVRSDDGTIDLFVRNTMNPVENLDVALVERAGDRNLAVESHRTDDLRRHLPVAKLPNQHVLPEPRTLAVSRWLASTKLEEIAGLSKDDLRDRIKRDCNPKEFDEASLEDDLAGIIARRDEILPRDQTTGFA